MYSALISTIDYSIDYFFIKNLNHSYLIQQLGFNYKFKNFNHFKC
jgi:hypothetical protein